VSLGFFANAADGHGGHANGYVTGFWVACVCDLALALGSLALTRLLAARSGRGYLHQGYAGHLLVSG